MNVQEIWLEVNENYEEMGCAAITETEFAYLKSRLEMLTSLQRSTKIEKMEVGGILAILLITERISGIDCAFKKRWVRKIYDKVRNDFNA